jgi:hypothetical protein
MPLAQFNQIISLQRSERMLLRAIERSNSIGHKKQAQYLSEQLTTTRSMISQLQNQ